MTPTLQTSTLEDIFGGALPMTKHSGGRYLVRRSVVSYDKQIGRADVKKKIQKGDPPIRAGALRREVHAEFGTVALVVHYLTETEVCYFNLAAQHAAAEQNVAWK